MPESLALPLVLLACPVVMGLMMWYMMRGNHQQALSRTSPPDAELARLRARSRPAAGCSA